jgi:hypothetical protein
LLLIYFLYLKRLISFETYVHYKSEITIVIPLKVWKENLLFLISDTVKSL